MAAGLALNPGTPLETVESYLPHCDSVLVMSVPAGFGGQSFQPESLQRLQRLRSLAPELLLQVDGGVNQNTIESCCEAGADWLVVGSGIFRADSYDTALRGLRALLPDPERAARDPR